MRKNFDDPKREFLVKALSLGLFVAPNLAGLFQQSHALGSISKKLPAGQSIYKLKGDVTVDGKAADVNTHIGPNSFIKTGDSSRIVFVVATDAFILRSNSELEMESSDGLIIEGMRILSGKILSVFGRREKPHSITTSTATIGVRGTGVYIESNPEKSYVCTCYGHTRIVASADPGVSTDVITKRHDKPFYILASARDNKLILPAPVINHTDTELALIESLVGRTTPYKVGGYKKRGTGDGGNY